MPAGGSFHGRVVVVTGAAGGIGIALARRFAAAGARLALLDLDRDLLASRLAEAGLPSADHLLAACDVADEGMVAATVAAILDRFGRVDVLVNNAANLTPLTPVADLPLAAWREALDVNLTGAFLMARACLAPMRTVRRGVIVNVASQLAHVTTEGRAPYSASKAGLLSLTRSIALDHARDGIRCVSLSPGAVMTGRLTRLIGSPDEVTARLAPDYPAGRLGTADEVAAAALFLASDDAAFATGTDMVVDGGYTAR